MQWVQSPDLEVWTINIRMELYRRPRHVCTSLLKKPRLVLTELLDQKQVLLIVSTVGGVRAGGAFGPSPSVFSNVVVLEILL